MARQKSDRRAVPQGVRKVAPTESVESERGGKAATVEQQAWQLGLHLETAESPQGSDGRAVSHRRDPAKHAAPKSRGNEKKVRPNSQVPNVSEAN